MNMAGLSDHGEVVLELQRGVELGDVDFFIFFSGSFLHF